MSDMRSGVGAFCPRSRFDDVVFLDDFFRCVELAGLELDDAELFCAVAGTAADAAHTPSPAAPSSVRGRCVAFRTRIGACTGCRSIAIADCQPELCPTDKASGSGQRPACAEP